MALSPCLEVAGQSSSETGPSTEPLRAFYCVSECPSDRFETIPSSCCTPRPGDLAVYPLTSPFVPAGKTPQEDSCQLPRVRQGTVRDATVG